MAYRLRKAESLEDGFARIATEELDAAVKQLREHLDEDPVKAIHEARKSLKKERALLRLMRDALPREVYRAENAAFRDPGRRLSGTRDAQVALQTLDKLRERYAGQLPEATFDRLRRALERRQPRTGRGSAVRAVAQSVAAELEQARGRLERWSGRPVRWKQVERALERTYARGRARLEAAAGDGGDEDFHEWRKRVKDLWYHQRVLHPLWDGVMGRQATELDQLGELLGDDQDLANLRRSLAEERSLTAAVADDLDPLVELIDRRRAQLHEQALRLGRRIYAESPKAYRRRHRSYYRAWRDEQDAPPVDAASAPAAA